MGPVEWIQEKKYIRMDAEKQSKTRNTFYFMVTGRTEYCKWKRPLIK